MLFALQSVAAELYKDIYFCTVNSVAAVLYRDISFALIIMKLLHSILLCVVCCSYCCSRNVYSFICVLFIVSLLHCVQV